VHALAAALRHARDPFDRRAQVSLHVDGEGFEGRDVEDAAALALRGTGANIRRSIAARKAARVLPDPVGARTSVLSPLAMAGHPSFCARVGASKVSANHSPTAGRKGERNGRLLTRPS